jgi:hypothetical protein
MAVAAAALHITTERLALAGSAVALLVRAIIVLRVQAVLQTQAVAAALVAFLQIRVAQVDLGSLSYAMRIPMILRAQSLDLPPLP